MNHLLKNKIEAKHVSIEELLNRKKFHIDYFQREYRWEEKHIKSLIDDLTTAFLKSYDPKHRRPETQHYQNYFLGSVVFSQKDGENSISIVDGQQRITSITLLLIYLGHLQKYRKDTVSISNLIHSENRGEKSFNMKEESRKPCLESLFDKGKYELQENDDETIKNMVERYADIDISFPDNLRNEALPYFIDWLIGNVIIVKIITYSDENAYTVFETMNDRGLNLTSTEMLKGYVLSKITDEKQRTEMNDIWKENIQKLHSCDKTADLSFFQAWFRGKYAEKMRPGKAGSQDQDFELIGARFHNWFKDNHEKLFKLKTSDDFFDFFKCQFPFYVKWHLKIWDAKIKYNKDTSHLYYMDKWSIADSLQAPLLLAPIKYDDHPDEIEKKLDFVARYVETYTVRRAINHKDFGQSAIKSAIFGVIKSLRDNPLLTLSDNLSNEINKIEQDWNGIEEFVLNQQNGRFVKHLLSRITGYIDELSGNPTDYTSYNLLGRNKRFEIEHIWANMFDKHKDEFEQKDDFDKWRNSIGALILLPYRTNQSLGDSTYEDKLNGYLKENIYAQTLHAGFYENNPKFLNEPKLKDLYFKPHKQFKKEDIEKRRDLVRRICEQLWTIDYFNRH